MINPLVQRVPDETELLLGKHGGQRKNVQRDRRLVLGHRGLDVRVGVRGKSEPLIIRLPPLGGISRSCRLRLENKKSPADNAEELGKELCACSRAAKLGRNSEMLEKNEFTEIPVVDKPHKLILCTAQGVEFRLAKLRGESRKIMPLAGRKSLCHDRENFLQRVSRGGRIFVPNFHIHFIYLEKSNFVQAQDNRIIIIND